MKRARKLHPPAVQSSVSEQKGYDLIKRFSEDIDVTVFRDDLEEPASVEDLEALSNKKRRAKLDAIRDACRAYITGPLNAFLAAQLADVTAGAGRVEIDDADPDGQTPLLWCIQRWNRAMAPMSDRQYVSSPAQNRRSIPTGR